MAYKWFGLNKNKTIPLSKVYSDNVVKGTVISEKMALQGLGLITSK